ncbi:T9SS type A sorting domain-containing protein, partial [Arthrospira platensis SPKY1]|nr:T9SS type A sorting domain-containing protein [Arthrospira platensis SPKY1]
YAPGPEATTSTWKYGAFAQGHYAEMVIRWLSGGGGGLSLSGTGALTAVPHPRSEMLEVQIFPLPTAGQLHIWSGAENTPLAAYALYDLSGRMLLSQQFAPAARVELDLHALPSGIFLLKLQAADGRM